MGPLTELHMTPQTYIHLVKIKFIWTLLSQPLKYHHRNGLYLKAFDARAGQISRAITVLVLERATGKPNEHTDNYRYIKKAWPITSKLLRGKVVDGPF